MHEDEAKRSVGLCIPSRDKAPLGQAACACPRKRSKSPILRSAKSIGFVTGRRFRLFYLVNLHILYLSVQNKMVMKVKGVGRGIEAAEAVPVEWRGLGLRSRVPGSR